MKNQILSLAMVAVAASVFVSCSQSSHSSEAVSQAASKEMSSSNSSGLAAADQLVDINDSKRKMMKTADLKMRVENVQQSTVLLERFTAQLGGLVMRSQMDNSIQSSKTLPYNADSLKLANAYQTTSYLQVKVPAQYLDSFLSAVAAQSAFIYSRNLLLEDATLQYISNDLKMKSNTGDAAASQSARMSKGTDDAINAGDYANDVAQDKIGKRIDNLAIQDNVKYATVSLAIEQPEKVDYVIVVNVSHQMEASFGTQATQALSAGWNIFKLFLIGLVHVWPLWIGLALGFLGYKVWKKRMVKLPAQVVNS